MELHARNKAWSIGPTIQFHLKERAAFGWLFFFLQIHKDVFLTMRRIQSIACIAVGLSLSFAVHSQYAPQTICVSAVDALRHIVYEGAFKHGHYHWDVKLSVAIFAAIVEGRRALRWVIQ